MSEDPTVALRVLWVPESEDSVPVPHELMRPAKSVAAITVRRDPRAFIFPPRIFLHSNAKDRGSSRTPRSFVVDIGKA